MDLTQAKQGFIHFETHNLCCLKIIWNLLKFVSNLYKIVLILSKILAAGMKNSRLVNKIILPKDYQDSPMKPLEKTIDAFLNIMPAVLYEYHQDQDGSGTIQYVSPNSKEILGYPSEYFIGQDLSVFLKITHKDDRRRYEQVDKEAYNNNFFTTEVRILWPSQEVRWVRVSSKPASKSNNGVVTWVGCVVDITALKHAQDEIKTLEGILPLCSFCKKIRDDKGYWEQVDTYINKYSKADISHSVCPDCMRKHYPEVYEK